MPISIPVDNTIRQNFKLLLLSTFLLSLCVLSFELTLIRVFSALLSANLAFLAITITLFGMALGGLIAYSIVHNRPAHSKFQQLSWWSFLFGLSVVAFVIFFRYIPITSGSDLGIIVILILATLPFCLANICLGLLFTSHNKITGKLYYADLVGAGIGVIVAVGLMNLISALDVLLVAGGIGLLAAWLFHPSPINAKGIGFAFVSLFILVLLNIQFSFIGVVESKLGRESDVLFSKWNSFSRITAHDKTGKFHDIDTLNSADPGSLPPELLIRIDSDAATNVIQMNDASQNFDLDFFDSSGIAYKLRPEGKSLIIGPGGGRDVLMALSQGQEVTGVEINNIIVDLMNHELLNYSGGLYTNPRFELVTAEGRSYLERTVRQFDVISLPLVDTWASTSAGNLALVESNLYTVEAFKAYMEHLTPNGLLSISRWDTDSLRLLSLFREAANKINIPNPARNVMVIGSKDNSGHILEVYLFKAESISSEEEENIINLSEKNNWDILYRPSQDNQPGRHSELLTSKDFSVFLRSQPFNLSPTTDNQPFFFYTQRFPPRTFNTVSINTRADGGLLLTVLLVTVGTLLLLIIPFILFKKPPAFLNSARYTLLILSYFCILGMAFLLTEIVLIQQFIIALEQPIFSYSIVLAVLLISAGFGSRLSDRVKSFNNFFKISLGVGPLIAVVAMVIPLIIHTILAWPLIIKIILAVLITTPLGLGMGMFFPMGLRLLSESGHSRLIAWAWAVNGAFSVLASVLAIIFSLLLGFRAVFLIAAILYLLASIILVLISKITKSESAASST